MIDNQRNITRILLDISSLGGRMLEASNDPIKLNGKSVILMNPKWMRDTGLFLGKSVLALSNLMFDEKIAKLDENSSPDTPDTARE